MKFAAILLAFLMGATASLAGEIEELGSFDAQCSYKFTGRIEPGDAAKIAALNTFGSAGASLCFNSRGGSLTEGVRMFNTIWDRQIHTRVIAGDRCESACAMAWLGGGTDEGTLAVRFASRSIEPGAILGFHAPSLPLPEGVEGPFSRKQIESAFTIALEAAEGYFDIKLTTQDNVDALNDYLYARILETPGDEMFRIDTVAEALMANVTISGVTALTQPSQANFIHLCENAYLQHLGVDVRLTDAAAHLAALRAVAEPGERLTLIGEDRVAIRMHGERRSQYVCVIDQSALGRHVTAARNYERDRMYLNGRAEVPTLRISLQRIDVGPGRPAEEVWKQVYNNWGTKIGSVEMPHYAFQEATQALTSLPRKAR
jgi:hypothetical protein